MKMLVDLFFQSFFQADINAFLLLMFYAAVISAKRGNTANKQPG
jgi:hypothetical protein